MSKKLTAWLIVVTIAVTLMSPVIAELQERSNYFEIPIESSPLSAETRSIEEWLMTDDSREELVAYIYKGFVNQADSMGFERDLMSELLLNAIQHGKVYMTTDEDSKEYIAIDIFEPECWFSFAYNPQTFYFLFAMSEESYPLTNIDSVMYKMYKVCYAVDPAGIISVITGKAGSSTDEADDGPFKAQYERLVECTGEPPMFWVLNNYEQADMSHAMRAAYIYGEFRYQENVLHANRQVTAEHLYHAIQNGTVYIGMTDITSDDVYVYFYGPSKACKVTYTPETGTLSARFIDNKTSEYAAESAVRRECQYYNKVDSGLLSLTVMIYINADCY